MWYGFDRHRRRCDQFILADGAVSDRSVYTSLTPVHLTSSNGVGKRFSYKKPSPEKKTATRVYLPKKSNQRKKKLRHERASPLLGVIGQLVNLLGTNWLYTLYVIYFLYLADKFQFLPSRFFLKESTRMSLAVCIYSFFSGGTSCSIFLLFLVIST